MVLNHNLKITPIPQEENPSDPIMHTQRVRAGHFVLEKRKTEAQASVYCCGCLTRFPVLIILGLNCEPGTNLRTIICINAFGANGSKRP